jgi:hypothetical protein
MITPPDRKPEENSGIGLTPNNELSEMVKIGL